MLTSEASRILRETTLTASTNAISSPASESGAMRLEMPDGQTILPFGQGAVHASHSVRAGSGKALTISAISGPHGSGSLRSVALTLSLANRLRAKTDLLGSTLFRLTWKERVTPSGRRICALRASARRTSGKGFTSWPTVSDSSKHGQRRGQLGEAANMASRPTPVANDDNKSVEAHMAMKRRMGGNRTAITSLQVTAQLAAWPTPNTPNGGRVMREEIAIKGKNPDGTKAQICFENAAMLAAWPTPQTHDVTERGNTEADHHYFPHDLSNAVKLAAWPTPQAIEQLDTPEKKKARGSHVGLNLAVAAQYAAGAHRGAAQALLTATGPMPHGSTAETKSIGQLNPAHSRWLQGLLHEWDDCGVTAIVSARRSQRHSLKRG